MVTLYNVVVIICLLMLQADLATLLCPTSCYCSTVRHKVTTDCSEASISWIPYGLDPDTHTFRASFNNIRTLRNNTFLNRSISNVTRIYLNNNKISTIHADAFKGLKALWWLSLEYNEIDFLHPTTFQHNPNLWKLVLNNNPILLPSEGPFIISTSLRILEMESCGFTNLPKDIFKNCSEVWTLRLDKNNLIAIDGLQNLNHLQSLSLHDNNLNASSIAVLSVSLKIEILNLSSNSLNVLNGQSYLFSPNLVTIDVGFCDLPFVPANFFLNLTLVQTIKLNNNKITSLHSETFKEMAKLENLYLNNNKISHIHSDTFLGNPNLLNLELQNNELTLNIDVPFIKSLSLENVDISYCKITLVDEKSFHYLPNLRSLKMGYNNVSFLNSTTFHHLPLLYELHLEHNLITVLPENLFIENSFLSHLNLSGNPLIIPRFETFLNISSLERLDISRCRLQYLYNYTFSLNPELKSLFLAGNSLAEMDFSIIIDLPNLVYLDLRNNPWECTCTLWPIWKWCSSKDCPEDVFCGNPSDHHWDYVDSLPCNNSTAKEREEISDEFDPNSEVEFVDRPLSGRHPPTRVIKT